MANRSLKESFETIGVWYLPDAPQTEIPGSLQYRPERTELHLNGSFDSSMRAFLGESNLKYYSTIYGTTREGEKVTLRDAYQDGLTINQRPTLSGGSMQERIISSWLLWENMYHLTPFSQVLVSAYPVCKYGCLSKLLKRHQNVIMRQDNLTRFIELEFTPGNYASGRA